MTVMHDDNDYRCKACGEVVPRGTHHKMEACGCGKVMVDRGWYGSRVLWEPEPGEKYDDCVETISSANSGGRRPDPKESRS